MKSELLYAYDHIYPVIMKCKYFLKIKYCAKTYVLKLCFISMTSLHISFDLQKTETFISTLPSNNTIYNDGIIQANIYIDGIMIEWVNYFVF